MKTNVADSSLEAFDSLRFRHLGAQEMLVVSAVAAFGDWVSRRQIATYTGLETATVAARVNALVCAGRLIESARTMACPITGRQVHMVTLPKVEEAA